MDVYRKQFFILVVIGILSYQCGFSIVSSNSIKNGSAYLSMNCFIVTVFYVVQ